ncbi:RHS repeat-associated core domain-containing protein [Fontisphaera persica]|uniref:RHS repeat-associated core domain-containing protein n=1 Tax=Fontisphaera persica TaxID=2974023 RepID=UPI003CCE0290
MGAVRTHVWGVDLSGTTHGAYSASRGFETGWVQAVGLGERTRPACRLRRPAEEESLLQETIASTSQSAPQYKYGPFGDLLRATGSPAQTFNHLFSTKYFDWETSLYYYGHRYYFSNHARWPNRDSLQEAGGINLYGFVQNNPVDYVDTDGRGIFKLPPIEIPWPKLPPIEVPWPKIPPFPWPKPKLPPVNPPNSVRCAGYLPFIGSTCDGGKPDSYPAGAYKCCKDFMDEYKCSDKVQCVANCLQAAEVNCQTEESCDNRNDCRKKAHVDCYSKCQFIPVKGVPASCIAIGLTGL